MPVFSHEQMSVEKQLLLRCARAKVGAQDSKKIRELLRYGVDWDALLADAHEHSVFPLLDRHLRAVAPELIPAVVAERLQRETRMNAVRCLALSAELIRITEALSARGISSLPYKGPVIAAQAYGDITTREFEDLDIVLRQRDLGRANEVVSDLGYEARFPAVHAHSASASMVPGEYNYSNAERRTALELHTEFTLRHFPKRPELEGFFSRAMNVDLGGRFARTFAPEDALIFLAVHAAKDFWLKLVWISDIAELIQSHPRLDWDGTRSRARHLQAHRMLHVSLALSRDFFEAKLPMEVAASVQADSQAAVLAGWAKGNLLTRDWRTLNSRERFHFRRHLVTGLTEGWRYSLRLALAPAEDDWMMMRLPRALAPMYMVLRPLRLLRKYS